MQKGANFTIVSTILLIGLTANFTKSLQSSLFLACVKTFSSLSKNRESSQVKSTSQDPVNVFNIRNLNR